jgi:hypothetical protein
MAGGRNVTCHRFDLPRETSKALQKLAIERGISLNALIIEITTLYARDHGFNVPWVQRRPVGAWED